MIMSELSFERCDDNWDLKAIVKGQANVSNNNNNNIMDLPLSYSWLEEYYQNQDNATLLLDELHQICTPNCHNISNISSPETIRDGTAIATTDNEKQKIVDHISYANNSATAPKRRRNKHKKTSVHQATGDRVAFDKWNWRKYGEKVIKGSPYPRSYYRCSSNAGGCLARKQVEQSCTHPGKFLITYIDDHTHPYPSHRPSQAGRTSKRFQASSVDMSTSKTKTTQTPSAPTRPQDTVLVHWDNDFDELFAGLEGLEMDVICDTTSLFSDQYRFPSNVA
ncbi:hypothetical protein KSS87_003482 [Heliosperma pusillum]|nr:hypothetical protein KSS87_007944 [Heliosperma pusillum]KAH9610474.1 hypothetical protein KSS87_003482 [Heliosperma pusillum]